MSKPDDIADDVWEDAKQWAHDATEPARRGEFVQDGWVIAIARALLSERTKAAEIAENWEGPEILMPFASKEHNEGAAMGMYEAAERISQAIRKGGKE